MFTSCRCGLKIHYWCKNKKKSQTIYVHALTISFLLWMYNDVLDTHMWARKLSIFFVSCIARVYFAHVFVRFFCLFACLWFSSHLRSFHSYENVTIADVGLKIFTYSPHSWPLNSDGSLAYHTYCDTGHPFIIVISEDMCHSQLLPSV